MSENENENEKETKKNKNIALKIFFINLEILKQK
jgi:hypothetical protein